MLPRISGVPASSGHDQEEVGQQSGVHPTEISRIEADKRATRASPRCSGWLQRLADALGVSASHRV